MTAASCLQRPPLLNPGTEMILWKKLYPVFTTRVELKSACHKDLATLCDRALQFALDLRRTTTEYRIVVPKPGEFVDCSPTSLMHEVSSRSDVARDQARITHTLFGALIRQRNMSSDSEVASDVLEKAQVVAEMSM